MVEKVVVVEAGSLLGCPSMSEAALMSSMQGTEAVMVSARDREGCVVCVCVCDAATSESE